MGQTSETSVATAVSALRERPSLRDWIERLLPYASVVALFTALSLLSPYFLTLQNLSSVCRQTAVITIIALGMTIIMISGGIDLSVGSVMAFAGICGTQLLESRQSLVASVAGAMLAGAAWGLLNSALITLLKVSPFIATLGTMGAARGVTLVITNPAGIDRLATSDPDGTFVIGGLAPGRYRLRVDDETFAPWSNDAVELGAGERKTIQIALQARIVAQTRGTISGTVIGPDGRPRADVLIILTNPAGIDRRATSEPSGAYVFGGLLPGAYRLRVEETGAQPLAIDGLALVAGERRLVDLRLQPVPIPPPPVPGPPGPGPKPGPAPRPPDDTKLRAKRAKPGFQGSDV